MKKYIKNITAALFLGIVLFSCEDDLNQNPPTAVDGSIVVTDFTSLNLLLTGYYGNLTSQYYTGTMFSEAPEFLGDNLVRFPGGFPQYINMAEWAYVDNNGNITNTWLRLYRTVQGANDVIAKSVQAEGATEQQLNRVVGQAHLLRAMAYFDLIRYFGLSYDDNSGELGVPVYTENPTDPISFKPARNTVAEVYTQVYNDISMAMTMLADVDQPINGADKNFVDYNTANALASRVALYAKDWNDVVNYSTAVINQVPLATPAQFAGIYASDYDDTEVIFRVANNAGTRDVGTEIFFPSNGTVAYVPTTKFVELFSSTGAYNDSNDDIRFSVSLNASLVGGDNVDGIPFFAVDKYRGYNGLNVGDVDFPYFRVAEQYLNRAEAYLEMNMIDKANDDLEEVRKHRIDGYTHTDLEAGALRQAIRDERQKELFVEGHRWFDIKRYGIAIDRGNDCVAPAVNCSLPTNSEKLVFPIPLGEMNANPNMVQNPGY